MNESIDKQQFVDKQQGDRVELIKYNIRIVVATITVIIGFFLAFLPLFRVIHIDFNNILIIPYLTSSLTFVVAGVYFFITTWVKNPEFPRIFRSNDDSDL